MLSYLVDGSQQNIIYSEQNIASKNFKHSVLSLFSNCIFSSYSYILAAVSNLLASLGHTGRIIVLSHTLNILWCVITKTSHNVLSKCMILFWVTFIAILSHMQDPRATGWTPLWSILIWRWIFFRILVSSIVLLTLPIHNKVFIVLLLYSKNSGRNFGYIEVFNIKGKLKFFD